MFMKSKKIVITNSLYTDSPAVFHGKDDCHHPKLCGRMFDQGSCRFKSLHGPARQPVSASRKLGKTVNEAIGPPHQQGDGLSGGVERLAVPRDGSVRRHPFEPVTHEAEVVIEGVPDESPSAGQSLVVLREGLRVIPDAVEDALAVGDNKGKAARTYA